MKSDHASMVKKSGHVNEEHFASLIDGEVNKGSHADKKDVIDRNHRSHSVKAGEWWQIFLYGRDRLATNTIFQGLGNMANIMVDCIDSYPIDFEDYTRNKITAKLKLQPNMRLLLAELQKPRMLASFLDKSLFDAGNADFLSMHMGPANAGITEKQFHVFHKDEVVGALVSSISLRNSKARQKSQMDDQKVIFHSEVHNRNLGELEDRHDSRVHYRQMKFRLNAKLVFEILEKAINPTNEPWPQVTTHGKAVGLLK